MISDSLAEAVVHPPHLAARSRPTGLLPAVGMAMAACAAFFVVYAFYTVRGAYGSDWLTFYQAAERLRDGKPVYTVKAGFFNPPPVLLMMRGFVVLPYVPSRIVWGAISAALLLLSAGWTASACRWRPTWREALASSWWVLFSTPTALLVPLTGNLSALVVCGFALSLRLFAARRDGWAGAALALTLAKPQLAFLTLPVLLYCRRWKAAAGYMAAAALGVLISLPLVGIDEYRRYWSVQRTIAGWTTGNDALQLDVPGVHGMFMQQWPHSSAADLAANLCIGALFVALAVFWRGHGKQGMRGFTIGWALTVLVTLLASPFAHSYDQVLLLIPMVVCYVYWPRSWWKLPLLSALYVAPALVLMFRQHFAVPAMLAACVMLWLTARRGSGDDAADAKRSL